MQKGGVQLQVFTCFLDPHFWIKSYRHKAESMIKRMHEQVQANASQIKLCTQRKDMESDDGRIKFIIAIEGCHVLDNALNAIDDFYQHVLLAG